MTVDPLAQAAMVAYCDWDPTDAVADATILLDGNGTTSLFLPSLYVTDVTAVVVTLPDGTTYDAQIGTGADVSWSQNGELRWLPTAVYGVGCWPEGDRNVSVTYSGGYSPTPADLAAALDSLTTRMPKITSGLTSAKIGTASMTYAAAVASGGLLLVEQMVLDRYRIPRVR